MGQCAGLSLAAGLAVALLGTAASRADDCDARCGSSYCGATDEASAWKCDDDRRSCIASCLNEQSNGGTTGGNSSGAARATQYGAIAYSAATGGYGFTYNYANDTGAQRDAVAYCEQDARNAGDCRVLVSFHNNCGALARASEGTYGAGWGDGQQGAANEALRICAQYGGKDCQVLRTVCNGG